MAASPDDPRRALLRKAIQDRPWDVIVIGGGASGLGTALEAATRGYSTLLLEAEDYAKGTSSRSTKLIHGGVRYLAQGKLNFLRESLRERSRLKRNAPHLVQEGAFLIPAYRWWHLPFYGLGITLYDWLAGRHGLRPSRLLNRATALTQVPTLASTGLKGGILYYDGQFDDSRLAIALLRSLQAEGGVALNAAPVTGLLKQEGTLAGVTFRDAETGEEHRATARVVINATGVFADSVRRMDDPSAPAMLSPSQGAHIVVGKEFLPGGTAMLVPKTEDGRVLFALPWHGHTLIGTTDTEGVEVSIDPRPLEQEIDFILHHAARWLEPAPIRSDILSSFAGLRPLVKSPAGAASKSLSREHVIAVSASGLVSLVGGKWTTYRRMGEETIDRAETLAGWPRRASRTATFPLHGYSQTPQSGHWAAYGSDAATIRQMPGATTRLHPRFPYSEAEVCWAVRHEQARHVEDVLARRLRLLFLDARAGMEAAPRVTELMAGELGRDQTWRDREIAAFKRLAEGYIPG